MSANEVFDQARLRIAAIAGLLFWIVASFAQVHAEAYEAGETFRDCDVCSEKMVVPNGTFMMGSSELEEFRNGDEGPVHLVTIPSHLQSAGTS